MPRALECGEGGRESPEEGCARSQLHVGGEPPLESTPEVVPAMRAYVSYYHQFDTGLAQRRRAMGLEVVPVCKIYDLDELTRTEIWNDWSAPHHLFDALALAVYSAPTIHGPSQRATV